MDPQPIWILRQTLHPTHRHLRNTIPANHQQLVPKANIPMSLSREWSSLTPPMLQMPSSTVREQHFYCRRHPHQSPYAQWNLPAQTTPPVYMAQYPASTYRPTLASLVTSHTTKPTATKPTTISSPPTYWTLDRLCWLVMVLFSIRELCLPTNWHSLYLLEHCSHTNLTPMLWIGQVVPHKPTNSIWWTVILHSPQLLTLTGSGHIDQQHPQEPLSLSKHISALPPLDQWASTKHEITDGHDLACGISQGTATAISDGSYKQNYGTSCTILQGTNQSQCIICINAVPGPANCQSAYCANLQAFLQVS